jgi:hypothetical protein
MFVTRTYRAPVPIIENVETLDAVGEAEKVRAAHWVHLRSEVGVAALE